MRPNEGPSHRATLFNGHSANDARTEENGPGRGPDGASSAAWAALAREVALCERCRLARTRTHPVLYRGADRPQVLFVGEAPGAAEDLAGTPFVGRAGRRLDAAIVAIGLGGSEFGVLNLIKCRPPGNRFDAEAARACRPFLDRQIALLGPRLLVPLGAHALAALDPSAPPITRAAGVPRAGGPRPIFPLLHPAAALHAPKYRARWEEDVGRLALHWAELARRA